MPRYDFRCTLGHVTEKYLPIEHLKYGVCECGEASIQIPSRIAFKIVGKAVYNDCDDPWEGTPLEGQGEPNVLTYKSDKIFIDQGKKTQVGGRAKPVDWGRKIAEAQAP